MSDLISRKAVLDILKHSGVWHDRIEAIESLPSVEPNPFCALADRVCPFQGKEFVWCLTCPHISEEDRTLVKKAVEPKTGWWIPVDSFSAYGGDEATWGAHGNPIAFYYCSECKEHAYAGEDGESLLTDFCPHCGAKMEGGKE
jgi:hypothetical protein